SSPAIIARPAAGPGSVSSMGVGAGGDGEPVCLPPMPPHLPKSMGRLALLLAGLSMFGPFSIDAIFPAFPAMGVSLGADKLAMQQTISAYLVAYALMSLVHGPLS